MNSYKIGDFVTEEGASGITGIVTRIEKDLGYIEIKSWNEEKWVEADNVRPATETEQEWMAQRRFKPWMTILAEVRHSLSRLVTTDQFAANSEDYRNGYMAAISKLDECVASSMFMKP